MAKKDQSVTAAGADTPHVPQEIEVRQDRTPSTEFAQGPQSDPLAEQGTDQLSLPRIVVLQPMSQEVVRDEDPLQAGLFFDRLTKQPIGVKGRKFEFIPFKQFLTRVRMEPGKGLLCRSTDMISAQMLGGKTVDKKPTSNCKLCVLRLWPEERQALGEQLTEAEYSKGPPCSVVNNYLALRVEETETGRYPLALLQFMRTSSKAAKDLNGMWAESQQPLSAFVYSDTSVGVKGESGAYYRQDVARSRKATEDEQAQVANMVKFLGIDKTFIEKVADEGVAEEEAGGLSESGREKAHATAAAKGF